MPPASSTSRLPPRLAVAAFLALAAILLSWNLGAGSLLPSDDAIYARAAREALEQGRVLDVTWQGRPLFEKGPVLFWALEGAQAVLGPTDLAVRLPGVLAGVALLALLIAAGRAAGLTRGASIAGAGLVLASNLLVFNARRPMTDVPGVALGMAGFLLVAFGDGRGRAVAGGALLGLAALVKVVAPAPFVLALLLLQADRSFRRPGRLAWAFGAALAVALPWHLAMAAVHGRAFLDTYVGFHLLRRASTAVVGDGPGIYLDWFVEREGGTVLLLVAAVAGASLLAVRGHRSARAAAALLAGAVLPLAVSRTALPHYLVPLLPGLGLAGAAVVDAALRGRRPAMQAVAGGAVALGLSIAFLGASARDLADPDGGPGAKAVCAGLRSSGDVERLAAAVDLHDPALSWYCDRPVPFLGLDAGFLAATSGIPMLQGVVGPLTADVLRDLAARRALLVTVPGRLAALDEAASAAGLHLAGRRDFPGRVVVEVGR